MYFAGSFDFSNETLTVTKQKSLKFAVRVPLEKLIHAKKRIREEAPAAEGSSASDDSIAGVTAALSSSSLAAITSLRNAAVTAVATGSKHAVCVINGAIYGMGANASHQLGGGAMPQQINAWRELALTATNMGLTAPIAKVACGRRHTLALTANGELYSTGNNAFNQLGHSNRRGDWAAVRVGTNNVAEVCCGIDTSYALTAEGHVYSWGRGESLALGHPITRIEAIHPTTLLPIFVNIDVPTRIEGFVTKRVKILEISAGTEHLVARDDKDVYTCGQNSFGKLGTGDVQDQLTPVRVSFPEKKTVEKLLQVMAFGRATAVMKFNPDFGNLVYIFGKEGGSQDGTLTPRIISELPLSVARLVGGGPSSQMAAAIDSNGALLTWGQSTGMPSVLRPHDVPMGYPAEVTYFADRCVVKDLAAANGLMAIVIPDIEATLAKAADDLERYTKLQKASAAADETDNAADANSSGDDKGAPMPPDALLRDILVPYEKRMGAFGGAQRGVDVYDESLVAFYKQLLGEVNGSEFVAAMEKPPPYDPNANRPALNKHGARVLRNGSKVRVWMTDVYALGTITNANPLGLSLPSAAPSPALASASQLGGGGRSSGALPPRGASQSQPGSPFHGAAEAPRNTHFEVTWARDDWDPEIIELYSDDETLDEENENRWQKLWFLGEPTNTSL